MSSNQSSSMIQSSQILRSPRERKEFLRNVLTRTQILQENVSSRTIDNLESIIKDVDSVNYEASIDETINHQDEILLDSEMMNVSSNVLKRCTNSLTKDVSSYDPAEFAEKIKNYVQLIPDTMLELDEVNWSIIEDEVTRYFRRTPNHSTLLGTLTPLEKKTVLRKQPRARDAPAATKRPENVKTVDKDKDSLEQTVEKIRKFIFRYHKTHEKPLEFFKLILHPDSFGQTVENLLHVSFLVRDGILKLMNDETGKLIVLPCSKEMIAQAKKSGKSANVQNVMVLNIKQWRLIKNAYKLKKPMLDLVPNV